MVRTNTSLDLNALSMVELFTVQTTLCSLELEGKNAHWITADFALVPLLLAVPALVEVRTEGVYHLAQVHLLLRVVYVVEVLQAEQVQLQAVVYSLRQQPLYKLGVADRVVHQVHLSLQNQEVEELVVIFYYIGFVVYLDYWPLVQRIDLY